MIDFHVHAFPDAIAEKAIPKLAKIAQLAPHTDGTIRDLLRSMDRNGVQTSVLLPVATKPEQQFTINTWAAEMVAASNGRFFSFGSVHPSANDWREELARIKGLGLSGIKMHPDYQGFRVHEERVIPIYREIAALKLPLLIHAGYDPISPDFVHAEPAMTAQVLERVPDLFLIAAHMGGYSEADEVERHLVGKNLYFDLSMSQKIPDEQLLRMIRNHGADRILFASDTPWGSLDEDLARLHRLGLTASEFDSITETNARRILGG